MREEHLICPRCGANMDVDLENLQVKCPYCDYHEMLKIDLDRVIADKEETRREEKRLKEGTRREEKRLREKTRQRELELQYADKKHKRESFAPNMKVVLVGIVLLIAVGAGLFLFLSHSSSEKEHANNGDLRIPISSSEIEDGDYDYESLHSVFLDSGFKDVTLDRVEDVVLGLVTKDGEIEKVTVNGKTNFSEGTWVSNNSAVVITYHAKKRSQVISLLKSKLKNKMKIKDPKSNVFQALSDEYYCPNCGVELDGQHYDGKAFDPEDGVWICTECGEVIYDEEVASTMDIFPGTVWVCDKCESILNKQHGFKDSCELWVCTECGFKNSITEEAILE